MEHKNMRFQPCEAAFEVRRKDVLGRIGYLKTPRTRVETPALLPVVNPSKPVLTPKEMEEEYGVRALITNAYIVRKYFGQEAAEKGIHKFLGFGGLVATDSGAYQALRYGGIDARQEEILDFQEAIHPDVGVILDVPTGSEADEVHARFTVEETIRRADEAVKLRRKKDILWVGPIQGGTHLDLLAFSAREMSRRPYPILALGSPTAVMERYRYKTLVDMIATAKMNVPPSRPLHLFGAGHPSMLSFAVALGCDLFDSAAYALFAYEGRYMTEEGTFKLENMEYLPCGCPTCRKSTAGEMKSLGPGERARRLASHNLWATLSEVEKIKQAICEGRLWELLERRARAHPALLEAFRAFGKYSKFIERHSPSDKPRGIFYYGPESLARPEICRFRKRLERCLAGIAGSGAVLLVAQPWGQPPEEFAERAKEAAEKRLPGRKKALTLAFVPPLGAVPMELLDAYPAGKITAPQELDEETVEDAVKYSLGILGKIGCKVVAVSDGSPQAEKILGIGSWPGEKLTANLFKEGIGGDGIIRSREQEKRNPN
ncbi:MAG: tRNA guanosine(15) transglycosylase TgtA [Candidatus Brockarchaeota archaeon]|nr:tRNA guanosine(15) transglycosylase TgtA [Candidatus Brockarchaeota archaeon]